MSLVRHENKYFLSLGQYHALKQILQWSFSPTSHAYPVNSLYFDTLDYLFLRQKIEGEHQHIKVRVRTYQQVFDQHSGLSAFFLETKFKLNDTLAKSRHKLNDNFSQWQPQNWLRWIPCPKVRRIAEIHTLRPTCFVCYHREVFETQPIPHRLRITFDSALSAARPGIATKFMPMISPDAPPSVLMEIKFPHECFPLALQTLLKQFSLRRVYYSKYAAAMECLVKQHHPGK